MSLTTMTRDARDTQTNPRRPAGTDASESDQHQQLFYFPRMESLTPHHQQQQQQQQQQAGAGGGSNLVRHRNNLSTFSLSSHVSFTNRISTLEVYELIYGDGPPLGESPQETAERLYETHAGDYENPLVTASSHKVIGDIHALSRQLREVDVPGPLAMFKTLFRPSSERDWEEGSDTWFQALRVWSEMDEVYDSESFDGHRQSIIEHTLHILILPGIHSDARFSTTTEHAPPDADTSSLVSLPTGPGHVANPKPVLTIPGFPRLPLPSPLHMKLHVISRLSFNEQGRITRHRDFYDVRDVLALVPGVRMAQWIGTRAAARGLAWTCRLAAWVVFGRRKGGDDLAEDDMEGGLAPSASVVRAELNALGLYLHQTESVSTAGKLLSTTGRRPPCQAPDVDRE